MCALYFWKTVFIGFGQIFKSITKHCARKKGLEIEKHVLIQML